MIFVRLLAAPLEFIRKLLILLALIRKIRPSRLKSDDSGTEKIYNSRHLFHPQLNLLESGTQLNGSMASRYIYKPKKETRRHGTHRNVSTHFTGQERNVAGNDG